jgi:hypothetical protein
VLELNAVTDTTAIADTPTNEMIGMVLMYLFNMATTAANAAPVANASSVADATAVANIPTCDMVMMVLRRLLLMFPKAAGFYCAKSIMLILGCGNFDISNISSFLFL